MLENFPGNEYFSIEIASPFYTFDFSVVIKKLLKVLALSFLSPLIFDHPQGRRTPVLLNALLLSFHNVTCCSLLLDFARSLL